MANRFRLGRFLVWAQTLDLPDSISGGTPEILVWKVPISSGLYECLLKDGAVAEAKITDRMR